MSPGHKSALVALVIAAFPLLMLELICFFPENIKNKILNNHTLFNVMFFLFYSIVMYMYSQNLI